MARYGKLGTQYFDDAGDPLVNGKIHFYESGTTTEKDTFKDVNLSIKNTNPVLLTAAGRQPNIFFNGTARTVLTKNDGTQIEVRDPDGGDISGGAFQSWNSLRIYNDGDIVTGSDGNFYISIIDGNEAIDPTIDASSWTRIKFIRVYNSNELYNIGDIVQGSDGFLYSSLTDGNQGNNPLTDIVNWGPSSNLDLPPVILASGYQFAYNNF